MVTMKVFGGEELAKRLRELPKAVSGPILLAALKAAAEPIRSTAAAVVARSPDAPHIAEHMVISNASGRGRTAQEASVAIGPSKDQIYGVFLEFGTKKMGAQPFMRPAFDTHGATALEIIRQRLWDAIRKQAGSTTDTTTVGGRFG